MAIYKHDRGVELGSTEKQLRDLNPQPPDFMSGALTTRPRCLPLCYVRTLSIYATVDVFVENKVIVVGFVRRFGAFYKGHYSSWQHHYHMSTPKYFLPAEKKNKK